MWKTIKVGVATLVVALMIVLAGVVGYAINDGDGSSPDGGSTTTIGTDGEFTIIADAPKIQGGDNAGPGPGTLARAGLAACLAQGYATMFALRDVPFDRLSVEVQSDSNVANWFGIEGTTPGFQEIRHVVNVESPADPTEIMAAIDANDAGSTILNSFKKPINSKREVHINQQRDAAE